MISGIIKKTSDRYPSPSERQAICEYVQTLAARRAALEELRQNADAIAVAAVERGKQVYQQFERFHGKGFEKACRDLRMITSFCANATFVGETAFLDNCWLFWFQTILKAAHFTPQFMRDMFRWWDEAIRLRLSPEAYQLAKPVIDHIIRRLTDIPEPIRAEVGERLKTAARA